ncbi:biotin-[acetyl-CoA-carboxylase] ligase [Campylobacter blaseri]|uniref:Biotin--[acetyl-CoA-carboxylase] ligase n=1 Tax=Campylobacter blaseri TaxID=2042961 RepID=A0A2P8QZD4_9BACT|nr:biotin--[acetyl-CoA-carboxylase] ligase [Campylobacter blaseri]PSM51606.1 biotin--[acetyl-CoA-carboxylase] ligase [Campylobacter blaseri]PSM53399.1 biotin--[acetyl-CoA-carboxylase] ligase [Campylobacter blaseri]QKF86695.1 biotin-[acetyl-CoA-carboxylase] ligase [Campylobacter blaseri]
MAIEFIDSCESTQLLLIEKFKNNLISPPYFLVAFEQISGIGSRGNSWEGSFGNLHFSFCIDEKDISKDIPPQSISIYFAMLMRGILTSKGSKLWVKWPNDFYINNKKIGGLITNKIKSTYICGIGINLKNSPEFGDILDIDVEINSLVFEFFEILKKQISWKQIFSKFMLEFEKSRKFFSHIGNRKISLEFAKLCEDGAILINNKKVYSLR